MGGARSSTFSMFEEVKSVFSKDRSLPLLRTSLGLVTFASHHTTSAKVVAEELIALAVATEFICLIGDETDRGIRSGVNGQLVRQ